MRGLGQALRYGSVEVGGSAIRGMAVRAIRFEKKLREIDLPVTFSEVRLGSSPMHSTARGALVAALSET